MTSIANNIQIATIINNNENQDNIPIASVVDQIQEVEMINLNNNFFNDNENRQRRRIIRVNYSCYCRWIFTIGISFFLLFLLYIASNLHDNNNPTSAPVKSPMPTINKQCTNLNCSVTLWELKKQDGKNVIGYGKNVTIKLEDNFNYSIKLNRLRPNLNNKVSVLQIQGDGNCTVLYADLKLNPSQWYYCNYFYNCGTKSIGIYDLSNEINYINYSNQKIYNWDNKIGSIYLNQKFYCISS